VTGLLGLGQVGALGEAEVALQLDEGRFQEEAAAHGRHGGGPKHSRQGARAAVARSWSPFLATAPAPVGSQFGGTLLRAGYARESSSFGPSEGYSLSR
jgi:hypothetical protein